MDTPSVPGARIVMLCDWLPPDFGAVGQYAMTFARDLAGEGHDVALVGFSSHSGSCVEEEVGAGRLRVRRLHRPTYDRTNLLVRAWWTLGSNLALLWGARRELRRCDEVRFTGSPPFLVHFVIPVAKLLGIRTRYRITDFHPECLIAALGHSTPTLRMIGKVSEFWRRRADVIEVLGEDQARRLSASGVDTGRIELRRDPSPVTIQPGDAPESPPDETGDRGIILYSGNWGVAHDHETFLEGYRLLCQSRPGLAWLWLNATGKRVDGVVERLASLALPYTRTAPVPLERLPGVLLAADVHLITLEDAFVGYVMPSKVYACIASGRPILFIGSAGSDVHLLCGRYAARDYYARVDVGDVEGVHLALERLLDVGVRSRKRPVDIQQNG
jgi:hypothetical protein